MNDFEIQKIRDTAFCSGYNMAVSKYEKQIADLEKENAELKEKYLYVVNRSPCLAELEENITKAKEIIRKLYSHVFQGMGFMELNDFNVQKAEVEQFLNSEVEK